jgi:hypothetical protein
MPQLNKILWFAVLVAALLALRTPSSHAGTWVAFENTYTRGIDFPSTVTNTVTLTVTNTITLLNPATQYTLKAFNRGLQDTSTDLVSSSIVTLNGVQVLGPNNFNQNVTEVDIPIFPQARNTLSVQVRGQPGGVLAIQIIGLDSDPPSIAASPGTAPNAAGWYNSDVTVSFACSDKTSGVASCPSPITVSAEGANQVVSGTATDLAGNTATTSFNVNLDKTPPAISAAVSPPPDAAGWNSSAVTVTFTCSDMSSGVASCPPPVAVTTEGAGQIVTGTATDVAGNIGKLDITVNISFNFFKVRSWQAGANGNAASPSGKCLDYGVSPSGNGATVFLNDCGSAQAIRVVEIGDRTDSQGNVFRHEVILFAGALVIGIHNPPTISQGGPPPPPQTEYAIELQAYRPILGDYRQPDFQTRWR